MPTVQVAKVATTVRVVRRVATTRVATTVQVVRVATTRVAITTIVRVVSISARAVRVAVRVSVPPCAILPSVMPIGYSTVRSVEISALSTTGNTALKALV